MLSNNNMSLGEKWAADIRSMERAPIKKSAFPQCELCANYIKKQAMNCKVYVSENKPRHVCAATKECQYFSSPDPLVLNPDSIEESRLFGGIFGFVIGDMLGVPVEFSTRQERDADPVMEMRAYGTYYQPFGSWSDDTSLMLCLMDAYDSDDMIGKLRDNMVGYYRQALFTPRGYLFDIGNSTVNAIRRMENGTPPLEAGGSSSMDNGNGSLMRILPLAFLAHKMKPEEFVRLTEDVSSLTHAHPRSKLACVFYAFFASGLYTGMSKMDAYDHAVSAVREQCAKTCSGEFHLYRSIFSKDILQYQRGHIQSSGYVVDTLEAVIWTFCLTDSYEEAVLSAINLGGDTDTIAALVGGLCGIYYGYNSLPEKWLQCVCKKEQIAELTDHFCKIVCG